MESSLGLPPPAEAAETLQGWGWALRGWGQPRSSSHRGQDHPLSPCRPHPAQPWGAPAAFPQNPGRFPVRCGLRDPPQEALLTLFYNKHVLPFAGQVPTTAGGPRTCAQPEPHAGSCPRDRCSCIRPPDPRDRGAGGAGGLPQPRARPGVSPAQDHGAPLPAGLPLLHPAKPLCTSNTGN